MSPIPNPQPHQWGYGYSHAGPVALRADILINGVLNTNIADQNLLRDTFELHVDKSTGAVTCEFEVSQRGGGLDISECDQEIHIYDATAVPYIRYASLITTGAISSSDGAEKIWKIRATGKGEAILKNPPLQVLSQWPPGDGTPVVDTVSSTSILGVPTVAAFNVADPANIQVGKAYYAYKDDFSNYERITILSLAGRTATAFFNTSKGIVSGQAWHLTGGLTNVELLGTGWYAQDPSAHNVVAAVATGPHTISPVHTDGTAFMTGIFFGQAGSPDCYVYCCNADGSAPEMVKTTAATSSTFTGTFAIAKTANWKCYPMLWNYGFYDYFLNNSSQATVAADIAPGARTVSVGVGNMTNIYVNRFLWVENADGSNREQVMVTAVGTGTFTATFSFAKTGSVTPWIVYCGIPCLTNAIDEVQTSLGVLKWPVGTKPIDIPTQVRDITPNAPNVSTVSYSSYSAGYRTVAVDDATGIQIGDILRCYNDDLSQSERAPVAAVSGNNITLLLTLPKTGTGGAPWHLVGGQAPQVYYTWPSDNGANTKGWEIQAMYRDSFDTNTRAIVELTDAIVINPDTQAAYEEYERDVDSTERITHQDVFSSDFTVYGSYTDLAAEAALKRRKSGDVIVRDDVFSIEVANDIAQRTVRNFGRLRDTVQGIKTHTLIDQYLMHDILAIKWGHTFEGGTPEFLPLTHYTLHFPEGVPEHMLDLGDAIPGQGDAPTPLFGSGSVRDTRGPDPPTWAAAGGWLLSNIYNPATDRVSMHIAWIAAGLDIGYFLAEANDGRGWQRQRVDWPTLDCYFNDLLPDGVPVQFRVHAFDRAQPPNPSRPSAIVTANTTVHTLPTAPVLDQAGISQVYDPEARQTAVTVPVTTISPSPTLTCIFWYVSVGGQAADRFTRAPYSASETFYMTPGQSFEIYATALAWGREGGQSNHVTGTAVGYAPTLLINGSFEEGVRHQPGWPLAWDRTEGGGSTAQRSSGTITAYDGLFYGDLFKNSSGVDPRFLSNLIDVDPRRVYRLRVARRADVGATTGLLEILWFDGGGAQVGGPMSLVPPSGAAPTTLWIVDSMTARPPGLNVTQARIRLTNNNSATSHLYVDAVDWAAQVDKPDTRRYIPNTLENGNFDVADASGLVPDATTVTTAGGGLFSFPDTTHVLAGVQSFKMSVVSGQNVTLLFDPVSVIDTPTSGAYMQYGRASYWASSGTGTVRARLRFYDKAGGALATFDIFNGAPLPSANISKEGKVAPPAGSVTCRLELFATGAGLGVLDVWWGGNECHKASSSAGTGTLNLTDWPLNVTDGLGNTVELTLVNTQLALNAIPLALTVFRQLNDVTIANDTTETSLFDGSGSGTRQVIGGVMQAGSVVRLKMSGTIDDAATAVIHNYINVYLRSGGGDTLLITSPDISINAQNAAPWELDLTITCRVPGISGTLTVIGSFTWLSDGASGAPTINKVPLRLAGGTSTITADTSVPQTPDITWTWGVADPTYTITCTSATQELMV